MKDVLYGAVTVGVLVIMVVVIQIWAVLEQILKILQQN